MMDFQVCDAIYCSQKLEGSICPRCHLTVFAETRDEPDLSDTTAE